MSSFTNKPKAFNKQLTRKNVQWFLFCFLALEILNLTTLEADVISLGQKEADYTTQVITIND
jgi:hypothetical protein